MRRPPRHFCDSAAPDFDAELHDWVLVPWPRYRDVYVIAGAVIGDRKGRFADGRGIQTSMILTPIKHIAEGTIVQTLNTRYRLGVRRRRN
jgi:hypothetical protein